MDKRREHVQKRVKTRQKRPGNVRKRRGDVQRRGGNMVNALEKRHGNARIRRRRQRTP